MKVVTGCDFKLKNIIGHKLSRIVSALSPHNRKSCGNLPDANLDVFRLIPI